MRHLDPVARRCFEEEAWQRSPKVGGELAVWIVLAISLVFHLLVIPLDWWWVAVIMFLVLAKPFIFVAAVSEEELANLFSAIIAAIKSPPHVRARMKRFRARDPEVVVLVCTFAAREYGDRIASERERALGRDSRWARKRDTISRAADGANGALAYWSDRAGAEPGSKAVREQLRAASRLTLKLAPALLSLDRAASAVRRTFDACRERVENMERRIDDLRRVGQLDDLKDASGAGQALADTSVKAIAEELVSEAEEVGAALAELSQLKVAAPSELATENVEQLVDEVVVESERATEVVADLGPTAESEVQDTAAAQEPWPDPADRIAELERQRMESEAEFQQRNREIRARFEQRDQEIQAEFEQREREIQEESLQRRQEILERSLQRRREISARYGLDPPATTLDPGSGATDSLDPMPEDHSRAPAPATSTSSQASAGMSEAEEEKKMKELIGMLRRMAEVQDRRAHDLRFRDEFNWEADDREELAEKMTELADEIEMFQTLCKRMKDVESGNSGR